MARRELILLLFLVSFVTFSRADEEGPAKGGLPKDVITPAGILLRFDQADLTQVVDLYGRITERVIIPAPDLKGKITILNRARVDRATAARLIESALELQGYVVIPEGNVAKLVRTRDAVKRMLPTVVTAGRSPALAGVNRMQTHVVPLKRSKAEDVKNLISPLLSNEGTIQTNPRTNVLVVTEVGTNMARLLELVDLADRPLSREEDFVQTVELKFVDPKKMVADIKDYFKDTTLTYLPNDRLQLLVISGRRPDVEKAATIVQQLDRPLQASHIANQIIRVQYAKATDIADLVLRLYKGRADAPPPTFSVNADKVSNTVILTGPPDLRAEIARVIEQVDVRYDQVLLKFLIGEVNNRPSRDLGVQWQYLRDATEIINDAGSIGASVDRSALRTATPGFRYSVIHPNGYSHFIQAIENTGAIDILAAPQVSVANNKTAILNIGDRVPVVTAQRVSDNSNTIVNQNEFVDTGITVKATPAITPGREVSLDLDFKFSEVGVQLSQNVNPTFSNRQAMTNVLIKDEHTLVIGGLMRRDHGRNEQRVPFFGRLPVLGPFFRLRRDRNLKQELILLLTPTIIETSPEADRVADAYKANAFKKGSHSSYRQSFQDELKYLEHLSAGPTTPPTAPVALLPRKRGTKVVSLEVDGEPANRIAPVMPFVPKAAPPAPHIAPLLGAAPVSQPASVPATAPAKPPVDPVTWWRTGRKGPYPYALSR